MKAMHRVVKEVSPNEDYTLSIVYENGETGVLDVKPMLDFGVFRQLKDDYEAFKRVHLSFDTIGMGLRRRSRSWICLREVCDACDRVILKLQTVSNSTLDPCHHFIGKLACRFGWKSFRIKRAELETQKDCFHR
jgi:Protein of unknown function (DUF2442)